MNGDDTVRLYVMLSVIFVIALTGMTLGIIGVSHKPKTVKQSSNDVGCSKHGGIDRKLIDTVGFTDYSQIVIPCKDGSLVKVS